MKTGLARLGRWYLLVMFTPDFTLKSGIYRHTLKLYRLQKISYTCIMDYLCTTQMEKK